jgi:hypothetical protein
MLLKLVLNYLDSSDPPISIFDLAVSIAYTTVPGSYF